MNYPYTVNPDLDEVVDERGNTVIMFRKVNWNGKEATLPEVRKWYLSGEGESPNKGFVFLTEDGPKNLAKAIIKHNYGTTTEYLEVLKDREDFNESLVSVIGEKAVSTAKKSKPATNYYDPREILK